MPPAALGKGAFSDYLPESHYIPANVEATSGDLKLGQMRTPKLRLLASNHY
jgi:hypothetical protein